MTADMIYLRIETEAADYTRVVLFSDDSHTLAASTDFENPYAGIDGRSCETTPQDLADLFTAEQLREIAEHMVPGEARYADEREKLEAALAVARY